MYCNCYITNGRGKYISQSFKIPQKSHKPYKSKVGQEEIKEMKIKEKKNLYSAIYGIYGNFLTAIIENENKNSSKKNKNN